MQFIDPIQDITFGENNSKIFLQTFRLPCNDGLSLVGQRWTNEAALGSDSNDNTVASRIRILCLHGFLDNCRTYHALAPRLLAGLSALMTNTPVELIAMDFPGHGKSDHVSMDHAPFAIMSNLTYFVAQVVHELHWESPGFILIGHSMGAMMSTMYTSAFPEQVQLLILLDGFGPDFERPHMISERLREHILQRYKTMREMKNPDKKKRIYKTVDDAVRVRLQTALNSPGNQYIGYSTAKEIVEWALVPVQTPNGVGWQFRHDPRMHWTLLQSHTLGQAFDYWKNIRHGRVATLWLRAEHGWPFHTKFLARTEYYLEDLVTVRILKGSHHFHADPEDVDDVAKVVVENIFQRVKTA